MQVESVPTYSCLRKRVQGTTCPFSQRTLSAGERTPGEEWTALFGSS
jgi:hypothetical protein